MALMKAKTIYGTVTGVPGNEPQTTVFKGVPFAKPPVGPLRFHEPVEPDPWDGELVCDKWPKCPRHGTKSPLPGASRIRRLSLYEYLYSSRIAKRQAACYVLDIWRWF